MFSFLRSNVKKIVFGIATLALVLTLSTGASAQAPARFVHRIEGEWEGSLTHDGQKMVVAVHLYPGGLYQMTLFVDGNPIPLSYGRVEVVAGSYLKFTASLDGTVITAKVHAINANRIEVTFDFGTVVMDRVSLDTK